MSTLAHILTLLVVVSPILIVVFSFVGLHVQGPDLISVAKRPWLFRWYR